MLQRCRVCGVVTGGLVESHGSPPTNPTFGWPESDLCPGCVGRPETNPADTAILAILDKARETERFTFHKSGMEPHGIVVFRSGTGEAATPDEIDVLLQKLNQ